MKVLALGGCGRVGMVAVAELVKSHSVSAVVIGDIDIDRARRLCRSLGSDKLSAMELDAGEHRALVEAMRDADLVCSFIGPYYRYGAQVLRAAIEARCNYLDVNDDYDATADALALHEDAQDAGVTAIVGMGATPGLVNIAARMDAGKLDQVEEIHLRWNVSTADLHEWEESATIDHVFHAVTDSHPQYLDSRWVDTEGMSGLERTCLPMLGEVDIYYLGNTQAITLPRCIEGVNSVTAKAGFAGMDEFTRKLRELGLLGTDVMQVQGSPLVLRDIGTELLSSLPEREPDAVPPPGFAATVAVCGIRNGVSVQFRYAMADSRSFVHCAGICAAIGVMTLAQGEIQASGVFSPEASMDPAVFFRRLAGYGIELRETQQSTQDLLGRDRGWSLKKQGKNQ